MRPAPKYFISIANKNESNERSLVRVFFDRRENLLYVTETSTLELYREGGNNLPADEVNLFKQNKKGRFF